MPRITSTVTFALGAVLIAAPALAAAQGGRVGPGPQGPGQPGARPSAVTALLNARRQLELTPRQVAQLDSLERLQVAERRAFAERMRPQRDSLQQRLRSGARTPALRDSLRAQARARQEASRPQLERFRQRDSALNAAAERVLSDVQRQRAREMAAARRGYERGLREGRNDRVRPRGGMRGQWGPAGPGGGGGTPMRRPPAPNGRI